MPLLRRNKYVIPAVVRRVVCDLPLCPISFDMKWNHLSDVQITDPNFGHPGWGGVYQKPPKFEHIFLAVITFFSFPLYKYF